MVESAALELDLQTALDRGVDWGSARLETTGKMLFGVVAVAAGGGVGAAESALVGADVGSNEEDRENTGGSVGSSIVAEKRRAAGGALGRMIEDLDRSTGACRTESESAGRRLAGIPGPEVEVVVVVGVDSAAYSGHIQLG
jgi:hypothetical protein